MVYLDPPSPTEPQKYTSRAPTHWTKRFFQSLWPPTSPVRGSGASWLQGVEKSLRYLRASSLEPKNKKKPYYFPLYWLVHRDPYYGLLKSRYNWVV